MHHDTYFSKSEIEGGRFIVNSWDIVFNLRKAHTILLAPPRQSDLFIPSIIIQDKRINEFEVIYGRVKLHKSLKIDDLEVDNFITDIRSSEQSH